MLDLAKDYKLEIRETENLPLPEVENRSRIDYIIFMIDLTNNFSFQRYQKIIHNIHPDYILTKCILVAFGIENKQYQVNIDDLENYTNSLNYDINCLFTTKKDSAYHDLAQKLLRNIQIAAHLKFQCGIRNIFTKEELKKYSSIYVINILFCCFWSSWSTRWWFSLTSRRACSLFSNMINSWSR